jgi:hypothetical protein
MGAGRKSTVIESPHPICQYTRKLVCTHLMLTSNLDTGCVVTITCSGQASLDMAYLFFYLALYDIGKQIPRVCH